ncbi:hypothetical protein [Aquimarina agarivorans]|uniref:hypothetical protein n=1 Tax=Aquimarina agarivorans TaxID=980584 RepID=UPI000248F8CD|nr:hypothetical protein [Aquimarina agarivorans]
MGKEMTLDVLSSIKGAKASQVVDDLFEVIKKGHIIDNSPSNYSNLNAVSIDNLRPDEVIKSTELERNLIIENFPNEKNGFLVVPKVIEE